MLSKVPFLHNQSLKSQILSIYIYNLIKASNALSQLINSYSQTSTIFIKPSLVKHLPSQTLSPLFRFHTNPLTIHNIFIFI